MSLLRSHKQGLAWLLAMLLFGSLGGTVLLSRSPVRSGCAAAIHVCCCGHRGPGCCCDGHAGRTKQLASLFACAGVDPLASRLLAPPAVLPPFAGDIARLRIIATASPLCNKVLAPIFTLPSTPPPQPA